MKKILMTAAMLVCFGAPAAFAEGHAGGKGAGMMDRKFAKDDANGDGVISKEEFLKSAEGKFTKMDANADGNLTKEEMHQHMAQKHQKMKEMKEKQEAAPAE